MRSTGRMVSPKLSSAACVTVPSTSEKVEASLYVCYYTAWHSGRAAICWEERWEMPKFCLMTKVKAVVLPPEC